jgi:hypothetical protein
MKLLCLLVGTACAVPLEHLNGGLGLDFSGMEFSDEMFTSTNATRRGLMQKQFLDRLNTIDFSREMPMHPNATKRDLIQKEWWRNLKAQVQSLINANNQLYSQITQKASMVTSLSSQIGEIHEVYNELTTARLKFPASRILGSRSTPWQWRTKSKATQALQTTSRATLKFSSRRRRRPWTSRSQSPC